MNLAKEILLISFRIEDKIESDQYNREYKQKKANEIIEHRITTECESVGKYKKNQKDKNK